MKNNKVTITSNVQAVKKYINSINGNITDTIKSGTVCRYLMTGTHSETGEKYTLEEIVIYRLLGGQIVEMWIANDSILNMALTGKITIPKEYLIIPESTEKPLAEQNITVDYSNVEENMNITG